MFRSSHRFLCAAPVHSVPVMLAILILAAFASSCARELPLAPTFTAPAVELAGVAGGEEAEAAPPGEVAVTLASGVRAEDVAADHGCGVLAGEALGYATLQSRPGQTTLSMTVELLADARVLTAEENLRLETPESRGQSFAFDDGQGSVANYAEQPAVMALNLRGAHAVSRGGGVRVAILDTGAELGHAALAGRVADGWDLIDGDADPTDVGDGIDNDGDGLSDEALGHGTHVAGIAALAAPGAQLLIVRVLDADGRGDVRAVAAGVEWAVAHGARVINLSLGTLGSSHAIQHALEVAELAGVVIVASAGNWGSEKPEEFPARSSHALGVAAVDVSDQAAPFTSYGGHVALSAPGVGIRSAFRNGVYTLWSGTSMAAPFVSGTAALLLALHPDWNQQMLMERLAATARPLDALNPGMHDKLGAGALDAGAALAPDAPRSGGRPRGPRDMQ